MIELPALLKSELLPYLPPLTYDSGLDSRGVSAFVRLEPAERANAAKSECPFTYVGVCELYLGNKNRLTYFCREPFDSVLKPGKPSMVVPTGVEPVTLGL